LGENELEFAIKNLLVVRNEFDRKQDFLLENGRDANWGPEVQDFKAFSVERTQINKNQTTLHFKMYYGKD
jgi:hypothetical protein